MPGKSDINYFIESQVSANKRFFPGFFTEEDYWKDHSKEGLMSLFDEAGSEVLGLKAPDTFFYEKAHSRLRELVSESTKYILILRSPTDRALSHYWLDYAKGREQEELSVALRQEEQRMRQSDFAKDHFSYKSRGFYAQSLKKWHARFGKESTLVLILDDLRNDPQSEWCKIQDFLGLTRHPYEDIPVSNQNIAMTMREGLGSLKGLAESYADMVFRITARLKLSNEAKIVWRNRLRKPFFKSVKGYETDPQVKKQLEEMYKPAIKELEDYLGRDLTKWK
ncbi:MAG: hypothetical protein Roseis2KO_05640 [Roseivirga sp.]